jgi:citrate lyase subunit beta/citryl-CoA lyase
MLRSMLYVPASSEKFIAKAHERGADGIILDLEDSVAPNAKDAARAGLLRSVPAVGRSGALVLVRINSEPERHFKDAEAAAEAGATALLVTKTRDADMIRRLAAHLDHHEAKRSPSERLRFIAVLEDPGAVLDARAIATASPRVMGLMVGSEDLATALDAEPTPEVLRVPKILVHMAAKAAGVSSFGLIRTVADYADTAAMTASAREARMFGFDGATCVHPSVVPILNAAFAPSAAEIDRARRMVETYDSALAAGVGAVAFEGKMIDVPVVDRARALLKRAQTLGNRA